jgi:hypothetical protein
MFKIIKIVLVVIKWLKLLCCYNSYEVLYVGRIYNLHVDAVVMILIFLILVRFLTVENVTYRLSRNIGK